MRRSTRRGLIVGVVAQRLGAWASRHPAGAVLALCVVFVLLGQFVLAGIVAAAVVVLAGADEPWRERWRRWWPR